MNINRAFKFGISSWSYPWSIGVVNGPQPAHKMTSLQLIEEAAALGVNLVQIADNFPLENLSSDDLSNLKKKAQELKVSIEVGTKGIEPDHLLKFLEIANFLESPILRTLPAIFGQRAPIEQVREKISQVLPEFKNAGVVIVLENQEAYKVAEYARLMNEINHPNLKICLDLANALGAMEGPDYVLDELAKFTGNLHFKDVKIVRSKTLMGFTIIGVSSGKGSIPIHKALQALKSHSLFPTVILELWPDWQGNIDSTIAYEKKMVKESVEFMKTLSW